MEKEHFKDLELKGLEGLYLIGSKGTLISKERISEYLWRDAKCSRTTQEHVIKVNNATNTELLAVTLKRNKYDKDGKVKKLIKHIYIHNAVAEHFTKTPKNIYAYMVKHIDDDTHNNDYLNLKWVRKRIYNGLDLRIEMPVTDSISGCNCRLAYLKFKADGTAYYRCPRCSEIIYTLQALNYNQKLKPLRNDKSKKRANR